MSTDKEIIDTILKRAIASLTDTDNIVGIFLIGSAANNSMDEYSDIDLLCVTKSDQNILSRKSFVDEISGIQIEVLFNTYNELVSYLDEEKGSVYKTIAHMISTGKILSDNNGQLVTLFQKATKVISSKIIISNNQSTMIKYSIQDFLSDAQRYFELNNPTIFSMYSEKIINNTIEASLITNNSYFRPPRQLMIFLESTDTDLSKLINDYYSSKFSDKLNIVTLIANHGLKILGGELPTNWEMKR